MLRKQFTLLKTVRAVIIIFALLFLLSASVVTFSYFSSRPRVYTPDGNSQFASVGMQISLLFDKLSSSAVADGTDIGIYDHTETSADGSTSDVNFTFDSTAEWGSARNPYIISDIRHIQNLYALQEIGYFKALYPCIANSEYTEKDGTEIPYFLVCTPEGKPVTIDGTLSDGTSLEMAPIGNDNFPFIGYVGGAFRLYDENGQPYLTEIGTTGKSSPVSVLHNLTVSSDTDIPDVGLFGTIGFIGEEPTTTDSQGNTVIDQTASFNANTSSVCNLVLSDITVAVSEPSPWQTVSDAIHRFAYSILGESSSADVPHENHHIGILAGHVEYTSVEKISVYYSGPDVKAIDLTHTGQSENGEYANYLSSSGIIGFLYSMNPDRTENGMISCGSGTNTSDLSIANNGIGTGGGLISGTGRGYVAAANIFDAYSYTDDNRQSGQTVWNYSYELNNTTVTGYGIMINFDSTQNYTLTDGTPVTVNPDGSVTADGNTWTDWICRKNSGSNEAPQYSYFYGNTDTPLTEFTETDLLIKSAVNQNGDLLSTEWVRNRLLWGTENTGRYYFYDGVFTFALSSDSDTIEDTWKNDSADTIVLGDNNDASWSADTTKGNNLVVAYIEPIKSLSELNAAAGEKIFIMTKPTDSTSFLMTLSQESKPNFDILKPSTWGDGNYTTTGIRENFATQAMVESMIQTLEGGELELPYPEAIDDLKNGTVELLSLGSSSDIDTLLNEFCIFAATQNQSDSNRSFIFSNGIVSGNSFLQGSNKLRIVNRRFLGNFYNIYCGSDDDVKKINFYRADSDDATVTFGADGVANISYTVNNQTRYVYYDSSMNTFTGSSSVQNEFYFYKLKGMSDADFGRITFDPETEYLAYSADTAVLFPQSSLTGADTALTVTDDPVYSLFTLEELYEQNTGWKNMYGEQLTSSDLHKKFTMAEGAGFGVMLNLLNGSIGLGSTHQVVAPVGTNGVEANIPQGCVAFRINKSGESKVRVIVAVPTCDFYREEDGNTLDYSEDYYVGLWQVEEAGGSMIQSFDSDASLEKFEIPRSHPYQPGTSAANADYILVDCNGNRYRSYLNGQRILVAYEFTVSEEGVYVLGYTNGPMEIVYFSADGTASAGRDGTGGSRLGSVDFVYDYNDVIVPVQDYESIPEEEQYSYYYSSLCLLFTDNSAKEESGAYVDLNSFSVFVERSVETDNTGQSADEFTRIFIKVYSGAGQEKYIQCIRYAPSSDQVVIENYSG